MGKVGKGDEMSGYITLSKEKGVNPHMTYCIRCGQDADELVLFGASDHVDVCSDCGITVFGGYKNYEGCPKCKGGRSGKTRRPLGSWEKVPASDFCKKCKDEVAVHQAEVAAGGVYVRCKDCNMSGVILGSHPFAVAARKELNIAAPLPCGIEFTKENGCPKCNGTLEEGEDGKGQEG